jgi:hypothetical protein
LDVLFGDSILMMSIDAAEGDGLVGFVDSLLELLRGKDVVNEDGGNKMAIFHELPFHLGNTAGDLGDKLVDGDDVARLNVGCRKMTLVMGGSPGLTLGLT